MPENPNRLTPKQIECLTRVAEGMTSKEIARDLGISARTVDDHVEKARIKLNASTRLRAAATFRAQLAEPAEIVSQKQNLSGVSVNTETEIVPHKAEELSLDGTISASDRAPYQIRPEPAAMDEQASAASADFPAPAVNDSGFVAFGHFPKTVEPPLASRQPKELRNHQSSPLATSMRILTIAAALALIALAYPQLVQGAEAIAAFILKTTSSSRAVAASR